MKILVIDQVATALDWIIRCQADGHQVKWFIPRNEPEWKDIGKGICEHITDYNDWWRWADLIFLSGNTKYNTQVDAWRKAGWPVIGCSPAAAKWETDRNFGQAVLKRNGIAVPPHQDFHSYDTAIAFVKKNMKRYVSKPDEADKDMSYCAKSPADMVFMLERWKKLNKIKSKFMLQEFISGVEMAVGGWFGPGGFDRGWCENWEFKKLMNDDLGVATGEQGTVLRYVAKSHLAKKVLQPLEDELAKMKYVGYIDVNCIIDEEGTPHPLEFTMRMGWPTFNIQQVLHKGDHAEWLVNLAEGTDSKNKVLDTIAVGVQMAIPDYPYSTLTKKELSGIPVYGLTDAIRPFFHPQDIQTGVAPHEVKGQIVNKPCWVTAGDHVAIVSGTGETVQEAQKLAYRNLKKLSLPNSPMYRTDIGNRLKKQLPLLQANGYATGMSYLTPA